MTSLSKSKDRPTFAVGAQDAMKDHTTQQVKEITFKTDRCQYVDGFRTKSLLDGPCSSDGVFEFDSYSRRIRFVDPKTQTRFSPKQQGRDQRPTKRPKVVKSAAVRSTDRSFSVRRPLKIRVPTDAWQLIFQRCDLGFLFRARLVCRSFRDVLDRQALWREARINQFGSELPDRPVAITEFQFARLLVGRGCQIVPCPRRDTRRVYWPFMLRMCDKCFNKMTEVPSLDCPEARSYSEMYCALDPCVKQTIPAQLPGLLPAGKLRSNRWAGPRALDSEHRRWLQASVTETYIVLTGDYDALRLDFNEKVQDDSAYFLSWARSKWVNTWEQMSMAVKLDEADFSDPRQSYNLRREKVALFAKKASELNPPLMFENLTKFWAYYNALDTPNAASLRSWDALKMKIDVPELRAQVEQLVLWEQESLGTGGEDVYRLVRWHRNASKHGGRVALEQKVVMEIARDELGKFLNIVHDEDVLLMWFNQVRRVYESLYQKPEGLNGDGSHGPYHLMLDDALMIEQEILHPILADAADGLHQYKKVLSSLRCIGCTRTDTAATYNFKGLIEHARKCHAGYVAKDCHWYKLAIPDGSTSSKDAVAWYRLPWFKTMPALPFHRRATSTMIWNPDMETLYIQRATPMSSSPLAFDVPIKYQTRIPTEDFNSNFCRAVGTLVPTRLDSPYIIKVALDYAKGRRCNSKDGSITVNQLQNLETICARFTSRLDFRFPCKLCTENTSTTPSARHRSRLPKPQNLLALTEHWQSRHWTEDEDLDVMQKILLPTETELVEAMTLEDGKLEGEKAAVSLRKSKGRALLDDPRTQALLETPSIRTCLGKLFAVKRQGMRLIEQQ